MRIFVHDKLFSDGRILICVYTVSGTAKVSCKPFCISYNSYCAFCLSKQKCYNLSGKLVIAEMKICRLMRHTILYMSAPATVLYVDVCDTTNNSCAHNSKPSYTIQYRECERRNVQSYINDRQEEMSIFHRHAQDMQF